MKFSVLFVTALIFTSCSSESEPEIVEKDNPSGQQQKSAYTYKVYLLQDVGWCYQIFKGSKLMIDQKHVPSVPGILGFSTKEKAEIAVQFIMKQIEAGNERPSVTPEQLDSIGAIDLNAPPPVSNDVVY